MLTEYGLSLTRRRLSTQTIRLRLFYMEKVEASLGALPDVTLEQLEQWIAQHPAWSDSTRQSAIASIRSFYKWATLAGVVPTNPAIELLSIRVHRRQSRMASEDDIRAGLKRGNVIEQAMIRLGAECGFRVSEIAALHRENRDGRWLTIVGKGDVQRTVAASPELEALLSDIERAWMRWGYYFPGRSGGHAHPSMIWRHIRDVVGVNPHALRHRAGTVVYRNLGNDIRGAQVFLGHANSSTTEIYLHIGRDDLARAADATRIAA